jgi:hypothetical protein
LETYYRLSVIVNVGFVKLTEPDVLLNFNDVNATVEVPTAWSAPDQDHGPA